MKNGWIKLHRSYRDWKYYNNLKYRIVWEEILFSASFEDSIKNNVEIKKGEFIFSFRSWTKKFKNFRPKISMQNLRTIIKNFQSDNQIEVKVIDKEKMTIIKIKNYEKYQQKTTLDDASTNTATNTDAERKLTQLKQETNTETNTLKIDQTVGESTVITKDYQGELFSVKENQHSNQIESSKNQHSDHVKLTQKLTPLKEVKNFKEEKKEIKKNRGLKPFGISHQENKKNKRPEKGPKRAVNAEENFKKVIDHLNQLTGRKFNPKTKNTQKLLKAVTGDDYTINDILMVIDFKVKDWSNKRFSDGTRASKYLTPDTLFRKFEKYYNEALESKQTGFNQQKIQDALANEKLKNESKKREVAEKKQKEIDELLKKYENCEGNVIGEGKFIGDFVSDDIPF